MILTLMLLAMLLCPELVMNAASDACRLFVTSVLPGLMPYMMLSQMLVSRVGKLRPWLLVLLGWGGGSPTGGRLLGMCSGLDGRQQVRLAVCCSTMSPMFLLGTAGGWLNSRPAGVAVLTGVLAGGWIAGQLAGTIPRKACDAIAERAIVPLSLGQAVETSMRTMLMICGTMALLRVMAAMACLAAERWLPGLMLPMTTLLEVTTGAVKIAALPLPLPLRTALIAGATGFGGAAVMMQNRSVWPQGLLSLAEQIAWQTVHGAVSFLIALGLMQLLP